MRHAVGHRKIKTDNSWQPGVCGSCQCRWPARWLEIVAGTGTHAPMQIEIHSARLPYGHGTYQTPNCFTCENMEVLYSYVHEDSVARWELAADPFSMTEKTLYATKTT